VIYGNVVAIVATVVGSALAAWGMMILAVLLFPNKSAIAARRIEAEPWKLFFAGLGSTIVLSVPVLILLNLPLPIFKTAGFFALCCVLALAFVGSGGLAKLVSERLREAGGADRAYPAVSKSAMLIVLASILPVFGWFFVAPITFCVSLGAGVMSILGRAVVNVPAPEVQ
jgi:hypothetical protein